MHPREWAVPVEWELDYAVSAEPLGIIRRLELPGRITFRAVTGAALSADRELIGYYLYGDDAAAAVWRRYCDTQHARHEVVSRMHGSRERGPVRGGTW